MSQSRLHLDFETFATVDLKKVGAYHYAFSKDCTILCAAMSLDDEEPVVWRQDIHTEPWLCDELEFDGIWQALEDPTVEIWAHNAMFEAAICQALLQKTFGIPCPALSRFRCTMSLARRASLPAKLEKLAEVLELKNLKDNRGKLLIKKFCEMQKAKAPTKKYPNGLPVRRIMPSDEPEAFAELCAYCAQDVRVEIEVSKRLAYFDSNPNNENYSLDAVINARGVPVNLKALRHAQKLIEEETAIVSKKFRELVGLEVTQGQAILEWINDHLLLKNQLPDLKAETVDTFLEQWENDELGYIPRVVCQALRMRASISYAAVKKVKTMIACAGPHDNRIRGTLNHHGATTGRWTASLTQFQNLKRSVLKYSEEAYREICDGVSREELELGNGPVLEVISSCIRHFVEDVQPDGSSRHLNDADFAAIEARIVCFLAGQMDALERFRAYDAAQTKEEKYELDPYRIMASIIFSIPVPKVNAFPQRFVGKGAELGCGFGLGADRFRASCMEKGYDLPEGLEHVAVDAWRDSHQMVCNFWKALDQAAVAAVVRKGEIFKAGDHIKFQCRDIEGMTFLLMRLPSGRNLAYPKPRIVPGKFGGSSVSFFQNLKGTLWGHNSGVWGGVWAENATQAVAADIMASGAHNCEREGYQIFALVHDQALAFYREGQTSERFVELLANTSSWANGLPIAAEGAFTPFYRKS